MGSALYFQLSLVDTCSANDGRLTLREMEGRHIFFPHAFQDQVVVPHIEPLRKRRCFLTQALDQCGRGNNAARGNVLQEAEGDIDTGANLGNGASQR